MPQTIQCAIEDTDKKICCMPSQYLLTSWDVKLKPKNNIRLEVLANNQKEEIKENSSHGKSLLNFQKLYLTYFVS